MKPNLALNELINHFVNEVLGKFDFNRFKNLRGRLAQVKYAKEMLPHLGEGSSRTVFAYSGSKALKIAINKKGLAQNEAEIMVYLKMSEGGYGDFVTRIYDYSKNHVWVLSEVVKPLNYDDAGEAKFKQLSGMPWVMFSRLIYPLGTGDTIKEAAQYVQKIYGEEREEYHFLEALIKNPNKYPLLKAIEYAMSRHIDLLRGDLDKIEHYGYSVDGRIVLLDYGFTREVKQEYY